MKSRFLKTIKVIINLSLFIQTALIIAAIISLFFFNSRYDDLSNRDKPCSPLVSISANNTMIVLNNDKLKDCEYSASIMTAFSKYTRVSLLIKFVFIFLITIQLSLIFKTFPTNIFQSIKNSNRVKYISIWISIWVLFDFIIRFYPRMIIPHYLIYSSTGLNNLEHGIFRSLLNLNFNLIFLAVIIYFLSIVFERGNDMQQELNQTV